MIRGAVVLLVPALVVALAAGRSEGGPDAHVVRAEFASARGLVEDADVRVEGAVAGTVDEIELTDRGTALVTARLHDGLEP